MTTTCTATTTNLSCGAVPIVIGPLAAQAPAGSPLTCGAAPNTCRAPKDGQVLEFPDGATDRPDTATLHRWACWVGSTAEQECSAPKSP